MKNLLLIILSVILSINIHAQENPFNRGVNLTQWFQANSPTEIHFTKYTRTDFKNIKSLGADVIRLPINLHSMTLGSPDYKLDPLFTRFLDEAINWAEELEINLILDNHTFDPAVSTESDIEEVLIPVWQNMAERYKDRSELIFYEILNEPHGIADSAWNRIQQNVIHAIRVIDSVHTIVVGPAGWNSYNNLKYMPEYEDDNLLYTFHFYDPFLFTHQGASWTDPSLVSLGGVPFPYDAARMPEVPSDLQGTWIESSLNNYRNDGTISKVRETLDIAIQFKEERQVPIFCGEFGVLMNNAENNDRILWYQIVRTYLEQNGIAWTNWDYHGGFGLFEKYSNGLFIYDLNTHLLGALGFNIPPQSEFELKPDSTGFGFYMDYIESGVQSSSSTSGTLNFYDANSKKGEYCISWYSPAQYSNIGFQFVPVKDLSYLVSNNFHIGFWVKSDNSQARFDIRFIDTKENSEDHPWRMGKRISNSDILFDGNWQYFEMPLSSMIELGSWDDEWFEPQGLFDWSTVDRLEIVDEHGALGSTTLWFDEIKIYDPSSTSVKDEYLTVVYELFQNYPNPFNPTTTIEFSIAEQSHVSLVVYDALGREVARLVDNNLIPGIYKQNFNAAHLSSGVYFYRLSTNNYSSIKKMLLIK